MEAGSIKLLNIKNMLQKIIAFSILVLSFWTLKGQEQQPHLEPRMQPRLEPHLQPVRTLAEVLKIALHNNSGLQRGEIVLQRIQIDYNQARLNTLPSVSANLSHGISQGRSVDPTTNQFTESTFGSGSQGLSADMTLFNGLGTLHSIRMRGQARQAGRLELEGQINEFKLDVIEAYIQVLTVTDVLEQAQNQLEVTREQLRRAEVMHQEGAFAPGDYYDIRGQLKNDENYIASNQQQLYAARLRLAKMMQVDEQDLGKLAALELRMTDHGTKASAVSLALFEQAKQGLPQFRALDHRIGEARQQIGFARSGFFPSLGLGAGLNSRYSNQYEASYKTQFDQNLGKFLSISLRIPIFNRLQTLNQVKMARLGYQDMLLQREIQLQTLKEETSKAVFDLDIASLAVRNLEEQVLNYSESFRIAQEHFEAGASNSFLFLSAKNKVDAARQQLLIKQYEFLLQQYINDYYRGTLAF